MKAYPSIEDLRERARRNVPKMFFDYAEACSYAQETLRANRADFEKIKLRQRILLDVDKRDLSTTILGEKVPLPLALGRRGASRSSRRCRAHSSSSRRPSSCSTRAEQLSTQSPSL